jgi:hypothetical protein
VSPSETLLALILILSFRYLADSCLLLIDHQLQPSHDPAQLSQGLFNFAPPAHALICAGALVYWSYQADMNDARTRVESGGQVISTMLGAVEFAELGRGMPLLSIHGAGGGYDQGLDIAADLVGSAYRIIAPSRRARSSADRQPRTGSRTE